MSSKATFLECDIKFTKFQFSILSTCVIQLWFEITEILSPTKGTYKKGV